LLKFRIRLISDILATKILINVCYNAYKLQYYYSKRFLNEIIY